jgi:hypothetical protein
MRCSCCRLQLLNQSLQELLAAFKVAQRLQHLPLALVQLEERLDGCRCEVDARAGFALAATLLTHLCSCRLRAVGNVLPATRMLELSICLALPALAARAAVLRLRKWSFASARSAASSPR